MGADPFNPAPGQTRSRMMMRRRRHSPSSNRASPAPLVVVSAIGRSHSCNVVRSGRLSGENPNASRSASSCSYRVGPRVA